MLWNEKKHYTFGRQTLWIESSVVLLQPLSPCAMRIQYLTTLNITGTGSQRLGEHNLH